VLALHFAVHAKDGTTDDANPILEPFLAQSSIGGSSEPSLTPLQIVQSSETYDSALPEWTKYLVGSVLDIQDRRVPSEKRANFPTRVIHPRGIAKHLEQEREPLYSKSLLQIELHE
jgi:hypothetical protein